MASAVPSVLCVGEVVWDLFPDQERLGGAPLNVAVHLARQGVPTALLTAVGRDERGRRALAFLAREGIPGARVHPGLPTGAVRVELDAAGVPRFTIEPGAAWSDLPGSGPAPVPARPRLLVFGALAMHSPANRRLLDQLAAGRPRPLRLCDLNLRPGWADPAVVRWCLDRADVLKVNAEEFQTLGGRTGAGAEGSGRALLARHRLRGLCVTLGPDGVRWLDRAGAALALPAWTGPDAPPVVDTVGAGDALTAALAWGLLAREPAAVFLDRGRRWAAAVCGIPGALPPGP